MRTVGLAVLLLLGTACTHVTPSPWIAGHRDDEPIVCGVREALTEASVRILIVHGMGSQDTYDYDNDLRDGIRDVLDLQIEGCTGPHRIADPGDVVHDYGGVRICTYRAPNGRAVQTYTLLWSPLSRAYKNGALAYDWDDQYAGARAYVNRRLKHELINLSFSDAILYSGWLNDEIAYSIKQAICAALTDQADLTQPCAGNASRAGRESYLIAVTHSLGSMALFATIRDLYFATETQKLAELMVERLAFVGMLANQLPLLALAKMDEPPSRTSLASVLGGLKPAFAGRRGEPLPIVAFSDPNDLLSYMVPDNWHLTLFPELNGSVRFVNYPVRNATPFMSLLSNPAKAHVGYWRNPTVIRTLADGLNCEPSPESTAVHSRLTSR